MSETDTDTDTDERSMPLLDHLIELRSRLLTSAIAILVLFFICYYFAPDLYNFLVAPLADVLEKMGGQRRLIFTALHEAFFTYIKVAFFAALFLSFPFIAIQIWMFIAPGLYKNEKKAFAPFLIATPILFFMGGALVYYFIFPLAWSFFLSFESVGGAGALPIQLEAKVDQYLSLVMRLIFAFGLCFELPVVMTLLGRVGMVTSKGMKEKRKYAIVLAFVAAAILTPPDVISQIGLALPTMLLYEISIISVKIVEKKRGDVDEDEEDDDDEDEEEEDVVDMDESDEADDLASP
ncbi:MAG: Sec-independent protein translocase protein TatC [Alphaproteobacteria bacterium MarineAlpha3_Bin2]|nr:MAG: Sec-independent protein translocase protein TatC [Alphaproteobacteria bacterium MarineAlpha3_Bin2]